MHEIADLLLDATELLSPGCEDLLFLGVLVLLLACVLLLPPLLFLL